MVDRRHRAVWLSVHPNGAQYGLDTRSVSRMARGCPVPAQARRLIGIGVQEDIDHAASS